MEDCAQLCAVFAGTFTHGHAESIDETCLCSSMRSSQISSVSLALAAGGGSAASAGSALNSASSEPSMCPQSCSEERDTSTRSFEAAASRLVVIKPHWSGISTAI